MPATKGAYEQAHCTKEITLNAAVRARSVGMCPPADHRVLERLYQMHERERGAKPRQYTIV